MKKNDNLLNHITQYFYHVSSLNVSKTCSTESHTEKLFAAVHSQVHIVTKLHYTVLKVRYAKASMLRSIACKTVEQL